MLEVAAPWPAEDPVLRPRVEVAGLDEPAGTPPIELVLPKFELNIEPNDAGNIPPKEVDTGSAGAGAAGAIVCVPVGADEPSPVTPDTGALCPGPVV